MVGYDETEGSSENEHFEHLALTVEEAAKIAAASRTAIYEALNRRELDGKKQGRRTIILRNALRSYLEGLPDYQPKPSQLDQSASK